MSDPRSVLPPSLAPRGLSRVQAAEYAGVGVTLFDQMVEDGRMPRPRLANSRKIWLRPELDEALAALPVDGPDGARSEWEGAEA